MTPNLDETPILVPPFDRAFICAYDKLANPTNNREAAYREGVGVVIKPETEIVYQPNAETLYVRIYGIHSGMLPSEKLLVLVEPTVTIRSKTWRHVVNTVLGVRKNTSIIVAVDTLRAHTTRLVTYDQQHYDRIPNPSGPQQVIAEAQALGLDVLQFTKDTAPEDIQAYFAALAKRTIAVDQCIKL